MNGILVINKHKGCTSHDIVHKIKKICNEKVGHTGTLDPMATGVLPLLIGKGTLCSKYLINHDKIYKATIQLGIETDTLDSEGIIIKKQDVDISILDLNNIEKALNSFIGKQSQVPPMYSAIKVNGKKLYQYAREGKNIEVQPRNIEIYNIKCLSFNKENLQIEFEVECSKGTYIRSLCRDISYKLGTIGYMADLQRVKVGDFSIEDSVSIDEITQNPSIINKFLIPVENLFSNNPIIVLNDKKLGLFLNGVMLNLNCNDGVYRVYHDDIFIGTGCVKDNILKRDIIL